MSPSNIKPAKVRVTYFTPTCDAVGQEELTADLVAHRKPGTQVVLNKVTYDVLSQEAVPDSPGEVWVNVEAAVFRPSSPG